MFTVGKHQLYNLPEISSFCSILIFRPASPLPSASAIIGDGTTSFLTKETTKTELYLNKRVEQAINYSILDMNTTPKRYRKIHSILSG
jgi:hypothetical protein